MKTDCSEEECILKYGADKSVDSIVLKVDGKYSDSEIKKLIEASFAIAQKKAYN